MFLNVKIIKNCDYIEKSNEPCKTCPRLITALHRCDILLEIQKEDLEDVINSL